MLPQVTDSAVSVFSVSYVRQYWWLSAVVYSVTYMWQIDGGLQGACTQ
jgi:hypothetical protein